MEALLRYVEETKSTNDDVMTLILEHAPHGSAVYAGSQTGGRGRQGRAWVSPPGANLALSIAIVGDSWAPLLRLVPLAVGVAMARVLEGQCGVKAGLKWPNDLYVNDKKVGGILCEGVHAGTRFMGAVAGIGVNLNMSADIFPEDVRQIATTVLDEAKCETDLAKFAAAAHRTILQELDALRSGGRKELLEAFAERDISRGRTVEILSSGRFGIADGIDRDGGLLVRFSDGSTQTVHSGEVHLHRGPVR